ncbi:hypothetical protein D4R20_03380 [bacterium]|nr:MAG: hypothetical protein D4R20_03380 [bacterium]
MRHLSIGISNNFLRLLEINGSGEISFVFESDLGFTSDELFTHGRRNGILAEEAGRVINALIKEYDFYNNNICLSIDTNQFFLSVIPIEYNESKEAINSNILWEISNYFPDSYKNFKINYFKLLYGTKSDSVHNTLIIAIHNKKIEVIKKISEFCGIKFSRIDSDHFSAEKYFRKIYYETPSDNIIIVTGCKNNRIDCSVLDKRGLLHYEYILYNGRSINDSVSVFADNITTLRNKMDINKAFFYGDEMTTSVLKLFSEKIKDLEIKLSDPFIELPLSSDLKRNDVETENDGYKFAPLCGQLL